MTAKHRRQCHAQLFAPRRAQTDNRYALHILDGSRDEYSIERHLTQRQASADDPWLSPLRSALVRECLIRIEAAAGHSPIDDEELPAIDLRGLCEDAELPRGHVDVLVLVGEGWSQRDIAEWLGISQTTVWRYWHDGRRKLTGWLPLDLQLELADAPAYPHLSSSDHDQRTTCCVRALTT